MRRVGGLLLRIFAITVLFMMLSAWLYSQIYTVGIGTSNVNIYPRGCWLIFRGTFWFGYGIWKHIPSDPPEENAASIFLNNDHAAVVQSFPGGWAAAGPDTGLELCLERWLSISLAVLLNAIVYGLWWRRQQTATLGED